MEYSMSKFTVKYDGDILEGCMGILEDGEIVGFETVEGFVMTEEEVEFYYEVEALNV